MLLKRRVRFERHLVPNRTMKIIWGAHAAGVSVSAASRNICVAAAGSAANPKFLFSPAPGPLQFAGMSKAERLATKILSGRSDKNLAFNDLCYVLERAGFQSRSGKGSHRIYYKEGIVEIVNVQPRDGKAKPYQVKQVRELLLKYKINIG